MVVYADSPEALFANEIPFVLKDSCNLLPSLQSSVMYMTPVFDATPTSNVVPRP